jgi:hypothetical protein
VFSGISYESKGLTMRTVAIAVVISMLQVPALFAGESLREAAVRAADRVVVAETAAARTTATLGDKTQKPAVAPVKAARRANFQQGPRGLEGTGMSRGMKLLLGAGVAAALAGIMLSIDGGVEDVTPSTKGERVNEPF